MAAERFTPRVVGRYELYEELASGGMATVYLGRLVGDLGFSKPVAIKRLHEHLARDQEVVTLLLEEARITERIRHRNVVATLDVVSDEGEVLLIMEYVYGETLAKLLRACAESRTRCSPEIAASIVHGALLGLHAAHETTDATGRPLSIIHRDVSPQNIILGVDGVARLLDFGIAKAVGSVLHTRTGEVKGKVPYMAPEVLRFEPATQQSDIWAMAVVLWEVLCARRLFKGESEIHVWGQVLTADLEAPGNVTGEPSPLDAVVMRGLSRDTATRYRTAEQMARDIEASIRLATAPEVAAWVASVAGSALASRAGLLRDLEQTPLSVSRRPAADAAQAPAQAQGPATTDTGVTAIPTPTSPSPGSRAPWALAAVLGFVVVLLAAARSPWLAGRSASPPITAASAAAAPTSTAPPAAVEPTPPTVASVFVPSVTVPSAITPAAPSSPTASAQRRIRPKGTATPSEPSASKPQTRPPTDCDPPYFVDEAGRKVFKPKCVSPP